ncbi:MAG TPA: DIP1984 family protein [Phototrophicaceae bacterium]|nr:DIP1984 family protein [Phototrophicaceae bacterium]
MKLAEALMLRADAQKRVQKLRERLNRSVKVQENDAPQELLTELQQTIAQYRELIQKINRTNAQTIISGEQTLTDALAERDALALERGVLDMVIQVAANPNFRVGRSEIKYVSTVDVAALQKQVDDLAKHYRELDTAIQQANWNVDLME